MLKESGVSGMKWGVRATKSGNAGIIQARMKTLLARMKKVDHYGNYSASKPKMTFVVKPLLRRMNREYGTLSTKMTKMRRSGKL